MKLQEIKQINITLLFSQPLNHILIDPKKVLECLKIGKEKLDQHSLIEAPGLKVFIFPNRQKEVIFEGNRLLVNDKSGLHPRKSEVTDYLSKIIKGGIVPQENIAAYGFNFDALVLDGKRSDLIGSRLVKAIRGEVEESGARAVFKRKDKRLDLQLNPAGSPKELIVHLNIHYSSSKLPKEKPLKQKTLKDFKEFQEIIKRL